MKRIISLFAVALAATVAHASTASMDTVLTNQELSNSDSIQLQNFVLGSGEPGVGKTDYLPVIGNNILHGPQYMPYHPTAATIWPRVIEVDCVNTFPKRAFAGPATFVDVEKSCEGYNWLPSMGRAEYLFVTPKVKVEEVRVIEGPERIILKEVPVKKVKQ